MTNSLGWFRAVFTSGTALLAFVPAESVAGQDAPVAALSAAHPWQDETLDADRRAALLAAAMTLEEKVSILHGGMGRTRLGLPAPAGALGSAGYVPGVPRLGIPALQQTDGGMGVTNPDNARPGDAATALPSTLATAATWNRSLAFQSGVVLGDESWRKGFNVMLAGGVNLLREPRGGRNFEYLGEDPLLAGTLAGDIIRGVQSRNVASTLKHFAINDEETDRFSVNIVIDEAAARESDLLAFQLAIEGGKPASVMCGYNRVNGAYACENDWLLNTVLKKNWAYPGWVMSDWGATHGVDAALKGLDQQSGEQLDHAPYFANELLEQAQREPAYQARVDDMVRRVLRSLFAVGVFDSPPVKSAIDYQANARASQQVAEEGVVLLKNALGLLPLQDVERVAIIGGMAEFGVLAGGGSSYTTAIEGPGIQIPAMGVAATGGVPRTMIYHPSSPFAALKALRPDISYSLNDGAYPAAAAKEAAAADVAIVFATQWATEGRDLVDLSLPNGQDALIAAVAAANPRTIVVLETSGPVAMPWIGAVGGVLASWYPGGRGGQALANVLTGRVNPSGRLPVTFPVSVAQLPRPTLTGAGRPAVRPKEDAPFVSVRYNEGADVGYRWYSRRRIKPLFAFGEGLSYTSFAYSNVKFSGGQTVTVTFDVTNTGSVEGSDVPQLYLTAMPTGTQRRLLGWDKIRLAPRETKRATIVVDRRLLATFDTAAQRWAIAGGSYNIALGRSAESLAMSDLVTITASTVAP
ncbi:beta-glucosidase family protein [Allosphingosinicella deserti]|uniref:Glycosyl hydrolase n=1 Tax=Allosphingosinicella deserti TaxID=2116704 RepID=A0A2P7QZP5_9SPHN|nr:glycoside hydrolase family 3 protein [Sphingomonas deserti]PSJ43437.1 glycosyl hydrolase [Sphingomonas deserti]